MMFTITDNRVLFLDPETAVKIEAAGIKVSESFTITRKGDGVKGSSLFWGVARLAGEPADLTFAVSQLPEAKPAQCADVASPPRNDASALVDAYAQVLKRSSTLCHGRIKPDDVKTLFVTAYIQRQKLLPRVVNTPPDSGPLPTLPSQIMLNGKRLGTCLALAIHGRKPQDARHPPPRRVSNPATRLSTASPEFWSAAKIR